jgi:menaquinol-cytochrome c reductase cytochrome b/c subunit
MAIEQKEIFPRDGQKTYGLMELVKGTSPIVEKEPEDTMMSWPQFVMVEVFAALVLMLALMVWSVVENAPLREMANPDVTENPAKAPWYFLGLQELLEHMHPMIAGVLLPLTVIACLAAIPYVDRATEGTGVWFGSKKAKRIALLGFVYALLILPLLVILDEKAPMKEVFKGKGFWAESLVPSWMIPISVILFLSVQLVFIVQRFKPTIRETIIGLFSAFVATAVVLTYVGCLFRGKGFRLNWPWHVATDMYFMTGPLLAVAVIFFLWWSLKGWPAQGGDATSGD